MNNTNEPVCTLAEAAALVGLKNRWALKYLIESGKVADVRQLAGRRVFTPSDIRRIRRTLEGVG